MEKLKKFTKWYVTVVLCVIFAVCTILYTHSIEGLVKPAGLMEAFQFLLQNPKEYTTCLLCGVAALITTGGLIIETVASVFYVIVVFVQGDYEDDRKYSIIMCIVNGVLAIATSIIQSKMLVGLSSLFWVIVVIFIFIFLWAQKD